MYKYRKSGIYHFNPRSREGSDHLIAAFKTWLEISIHAPARGATKRFTPAWSRARISIHAPARGATHIVLHVLRVLHDFNPRSREGSDEREQPKTERTEPFQSTLPRGERPAGATWWHGSTDFNPRSREGSDYLNTGIGGMQDDFNPRSREGSDALYLRW